MTDSVPTTTDSQDDQEVVLRENVVPDLCGISKQRSSESLTGVTPVHEDCDDYNMMHPNRGKCLVFNHWTYDDPNVEKRMGTYADVTRIQKSFGKLGFTVEVYHNKTYHTIMEIIRKLSKEDHKDNDCVCIIVLTHGQDNNMIQAKDKLYPLNKLWEPFTANKCISLAGKPKLFFISACRGDKHDKGLLLRHTQAPYERTVADGCSSLSYLIPTECDFLLGFSTAAGYSSWRGEETGTWYIQSLCDILDEYAVTTHLAEMLTKTALIVSKHDSRDSEDRRCQEKKQVPECHTRLLRRVYFKPKKQEEIFQQNGSPNREISDSERATSKIENTISQTNKSKTSCCEFL